MAEGTESYVFNVVGLLLLGVVTRCSVVLLVANEDGKLAFRVRTAPCKLA
jgi:hypothetical protein